MPGIANKLMKKYIKIIVLTLPNIKIYYNAT